MLVHKRKDAVLLQSRKLAKAAGVKVDGAGFGHLRHTFSSIADAAPDEKGHAKKITYQIVFDGLAQPFRATPERNTLEATIALRVVPTPAAAMAGLAMLSGVVLRRRSV